MHSSRVRTARLLPVSPSMHCSQGVYLVRGVPGRGGVPGPGGVYLVLGGVPGPGGCTWSRGVYLVRGCTWSWGVYLVPGVCTWSQGCVPGPGGCTWSRRDLPRYLPLPVDRMTDTCKNNLRKLRLRAVKMCYRATLIAVDFC